MDYRGGLENRCGPYGPPWVRIPPPPLFFLISQCQLLLSAKYIKTLIDVRLSGFLVFLLIQNPVKPWLTGSGILLAGSSHAEDKAHRQ